MQPDADLAHGCVQAAGAEEGLGYPAGDNAATRLGDGDEDSEDEDGAAAAAGALDTVPDSYTPALAQQ